MIFVEVIETKKDGKKERFGTFENMRWAKYHVALAESLSGQKGYINHEGSTWEYNTIEE